MTHKQIKQAHRAGYRPHEILREMVSAGMEFPDASSKIALALDLDLEQTAHMEQSYDEEVQR